MQLDKNGFTKSKKFGLKFKKMFWLFGSQSKLSIENIDYKTVFKNCVFLTKI